uniref:Uncharacterized protein n=1 Tax=Kalanchoe fedtschenkoi TaxID=63787 RepID=A0A7N0SWS6_KALFE
MSEKEETEFGSHLMDAFGSVWWYGAEDGGVNQPVAVVRREGGPLEVEAYHFTTRSQLAIFISITHF